MENHRRFNRCGPTQTPDDFDIDALREKYLFETELEAVERLRRESLESNRMGVSPRFDEFKVGDTLPRRVIGPHSMASFTTEYRAFLFNTWGTFARVAPPGIEDPWVYQDPGWGKDIAFDEEDAKIDPRERDGLYVGPSRGHIDAAG